MQEDLRAILEGSEGQALRALLQQVLRTPEGQQLARQLDQAVKNKKD